MPRASLRSVLRAGPIAVALLCAAGCGGAAEHPRPQAAPTPIPAAPVSVRDLPGSGRVVIANGWQGSFAGQKLSVAAGRYAAGGGVAVVAENGMLARELRAPRGAGALRFLRRSGGVLQLRARSGKRFTLDLRTLALEPKDGCPSGALAGPLPRLHARITHTGLRPLPPPRTHAFAALSAILAGAR